MASALRKRPSDREPSAGVSLKKRLYAWWNGYELRPRPAGHDDDGGDDPGGGHAPGETVYPWTEPRRQLAQELWSPGFIGPGGHAYVQKLVNGCNLTEAETLLEIGIGMGGGTRSVIGKFGNYVTAYERDPELAAAARRHATTYEFEDKLEVIEAPYNRIAARPGYYRAALLRDVLYTMEDKAGLLGKISTSLKGGESFVVMTDFLFRERDSSPALAAWIAAEQGRVFPWTEDDLTRCLKANRITPRIVEDESDEYRAMVVEAWKVFLQVLEARDLSGEMARQLEREGEFWARRAAALESGALKYCRIEGVKVS